MAQKVVPRQSDYQSFVSTMLEQVKENVPMPQPYIGIRPSQKDPEPQAHVPIQPKEKFPETKAHFSTIDDKSIRFVEEYVEKMKGKIS